jgi:hypothetical protein
MWNSHGRVVTTVEYFVALISSSKSRDRVVIASVVGVMVAALFALGMSAPAFADTQIWFTIKLTTKAGAPLSNYEIDPVAVADGRPVPNVSTSPMGSSDGFYSGYLTPNQTYVFLLVPTGASANSGSVQFLGGAQTIGDAEVITPTATNTFLAASVATGATIVGTVTGPTGAALSGAEVDEYEYDGTTWFANNYTIANSHGQYSFTNVDPGSYKFKFYAKGRAYPTTYSGGTTSLVSARATFIAVGTKATINQKMLRGTGQIYGTAQDKFEGFVFGRDRVVAGAFPVTAQTSGVATSIDPDRAVFGAPANSHGQWAVGNLLPGAYVIQFRPYYEGEVAEYLGSSGDKSMLANATVFTVAAGQKVNAHTSVTNVGDECFNDGYSCGGNLTVTVDDTASAPIAGAEVQLSPDTDPFFYVSGVSDIVGRTRLMFGDGTYVDASSNPLTPGWYTLTVIDPSGLHEPLTTEEYLDFGTSTTTVNLAALTVAPALSVPVITQSATAIGTQYEVTDVTSARVDAKVTYQWFRGGKPIYGATGTTYTSVGGDLGKQLSVEVTADSFGFEPVYAKAYVGGDDPTVETIGAAPVNDSGPSISPTSGIYLGTTLQAHVGNWTLDGAPATGLSYTYLWSNGATTSSVVVQKADLGTSMSVQVTAHKAGYADSDFAQSDDVTVLTHPTLAVTKSPVITATALNGVTTYSVSTGSWNTTGLTFTYLWSVGGVTKSTLRSVTSTLAGPLPALDPLTVVVTAHKDGYDNHDSAPIVAVKGTASFSFDSAPQATDVTTGSPVSGSDAVTFGDHLSVSHGVWLPLSPLSTLPDSYHYQWYRNGLVISGATAATYTVVAADVATSVGHPEGGQLSVVETPVSGRYASMSNSSLLVGTGTARPFSTAALVALHGAPADGQTITSTLVGSWGTTGVTVSYQWYGCATTAPCADPTDAGTFTPIPGGTTTSVVLHAASYTQVALAIVGKKSGYAATTAYSGVVNVNSATSIQSSGATTISGLVGGQAGVWQKLTAVAPKWSQTGVTLSYQWQTQPCVPSGCVEGDWVDVPAPLGTASTFTPTDALITPLTSLRVVVTAHKLGSTDSAAVYSEIYEVRPTLAKVITKPTITASTTAFTLKPGIISVAAQAVGTTTPTVTWFVNNAPYAGTPLANPLVFPRGIATGTTSTDLMLAQLDYSPLGYTSFGSSVVAQKGLANQTVNAEAIVGSHYGQRLSLTKSNDSGIAPWDQQLSQTYQWYSNGVAITGATKDTFTPSTGYIGRHLQVKVTGSSSYYTASPITTTSSFTLLPGVFAANPTAVPPTTGPTAPIVGFTGAVMPGTVLTATPSGDYGATGITFKYQWQRRANSGAAWANISGGTSSHYTPVATDVTQQLQVVVTATKSGYTSLSETSTTQVVQYSPTLATFVPPALTAAGGTAKVGVALTVTPGVWNTPGLTYAYQWYRNGVVIPGLAGTSFTPTASSFGDEIKVDVTASRPGYQSVEVDSAEVSIGAGAAPTLIAPPVITVKNGVYSISSGSWNTDGLTITYEWGVNNVDGAGAGQGTMSYTPLNSEVGAVVVIVTASRAGYAPSTVAVNGQPLL